MKKMTLQIAEPCHAAWEAMTPTEQGRFCASCCKTVVDFTAMSDRQLLAYFQKDNRSVCGRFYKDQLQRPLSLPNRRQALPNYFFRYSWPAFLLLLKSCDQIGNSDATVAGMLAVMPVPDTSKVVGDTIFQIQPDTPASREIQPVTDRCGSSMEFFPPVVKGETEVRTIPDSVEKKDPAFDPSFAAIDSSVIAIDSLFITTAQAQENIIMGKVLINTKEKDQKESVTASKTEQRVEPQQIRHVRLFPNPVPRGHFLTARFEEPVQGSYQLYTVSGQLLHSGRIPNGKSLQHQIGTENLKRGTYVIRFADERNRVEKTATFVVL